MVSGRNLVWDETMCKCGLGPLVADSETDFPVYKKQMIPRCKGPCKDPGIEQVRDNLMVHGRQLVHATLHSLMASLQLLPGADSQWTLSNPPLLLLKSSWVDPVLGRAQVSPAMALEDPGRAEQAGPLSW